jgi:hypothetical protein
MPYVKRFCGRCGASFFSHALKRESFGYVHQITSPDFPDHECRTPKVPREARSHVYGPRLSRTS